MDENSTTAVHPVWLSLPHAVQHKPVRENVINFKNSTLGRHNVHTVDIQNSTRQNSMKYSRSVILKR